MNRKTPPPGPPQDSGHPDFNAYPGYPGSQPGYPGPAGYPTDHPVRCAMRFLTFLKEKWWLPSLTMALGLAAGAALLAYQPAKYVSTGKLWFTGKMQVVAGSLTEEAQNFFGTQIELLESQKLEARAMERLKATHPDLTNVTIKVKVTQPPKTSVLQVEASCSEAAFASVFVNSLMEEFLAYKREVRASTADSTFTTVSENVRQREKELNAEREAIKKFQQENDISILQEQAASANSYLVKLNGQVSDLRLQFDVINSMEAELNRNLGDGSSAPDPRRLIDPSNPAVSPSPEYLVAKQQIEVLRIQRAELIQNLRPKHPKIVKLDDDLTRAERILEFNRRQTLEQIASSKQNIRLRMQSLEASVREWEGKLGNASRLLTEYDMRKGNVERLQSAFDRFAPTLQNMDMNRDINSDVVSVLEPAGPPKNSKEKSPMLLTGAGLFGFFFGIGLLLVLERLDDRMDSLTELTDQFTEEILGQIPEVEQEGASKRVQMLDPDDQRFMFAEAWRNLRSSLLFMAHADPKPKLLLVTSAIPSEGKSTVSLNLARAMAMAGSRVLFVDGDLRRGTVHEVLGTNREPGLTHLLSGASLRDEGKTPMDPFHDGTVAIGQPEPNGEFGKRLEKVIQSTALPNLFSIATGSYATNAAELILSPAADEFLRLVSGKFDYVVIDSAPVFAADDTTSLAPKVDGVVFVIRGAYTGAKTAKEALNQLYQRQVRVLGIVFNRVSVSDRGYRYYCYHDYDTGRGSRKVA